MPKNKEILKKLEECLKGNHTWQELLGTEDCNGEGESAKWCSVCGYVVIDKTVDGRVMLPGGIMKIKGPEISRFLESIVKQ